MRGRKTDSSFDLSEMNGREGFRRAEYFNDETDRLGTNSEKSWSAPKPGVFANLFGRKKCVLERPYLEHKRSKKQELADRGFVLVYLDKYVDSLGPPYFFGA